MDKRKLTLCVLLLLPILIIVVYSADNADSGSTTPAGAAQAGSYDSLYQGWKVSLYVAKADYVDTSNNYTLTNDYYLFGDMSVILKRSDCVIPATAIFGKYNKEQYKNGGKPYTEVNYSNVTIIETGKNGIPQAPYIPVISTERVGNIETVKAYFANENLINILANNIASSKGTTIANLLNQLTFTINGITKRGWNTEYLFPYPDFSSPTRLSNRVTWVIMYEPLVVSTLRAGTKVAFTSSEYALAQRVGRYNFFFRYGEASDSDVNKDRIGWPQNQAFPQRLTKLTHQMMPVAVYLEEPWLGYPSGESFGYPFDYQWPTSSTIAGGGIGMRSQPGNGMPVANYDFAVQNLKVTPSSVNRGNVARLEFTVVYQGNYAFDNALVEVFINDLKVELAYSSFNAHETKSFSFDIDTEFYEVGQYNVLVRVNYDTRSKETNPNNNTASGTFTVQKPTDFAVRNIVISPTGTMQGNSITVTFETVNLDPYHNYTGIIVELLVDGTVVQTWTINYERGQAMQLTHTINTASLAVGSHTVTVRINYANRASELDDTNNMATGSFAVTANYDFGLGNLLVAPASIKKGGIVTVSFTARNNDPYNSYSNVLVELLINGSVSQTMSLNFGAGEVKTGISFTVNSGSFTLGTQNVTVRINYANRSSETDPNNNTVSGSFAVTNPTDFAVDSLSITPTSTRRGNTVTISFRTLNNDLYNAYSNIKVEILVDGNVVHYEYINYSAGQTKTHSCTIDTADLIESGHAVEVRINYAYSSTENNANNNAVSGSFTVTTNKDFAVEDVKVNPVTTSKGNAVTVTFKTKNNDPYNSYSNVPVEVLVNGNVVQTLYLAYAPGQTRTDTYTINTASLAIGSHAVTVRIHYANRYEETNAGNNIVTTYFAVTNPMDFSIDPVVVAPKATKQGNEIKIDVTVWNNDPYTGYMNIPVDVFIDGVKYTYYIDFEAGKGVVLTLTINSNDYNVGLHTVYARVNYDNRNAEMNPDNNVSASTSFEVLGEIDLEFVRPNKDYLENTEVIASFMVHNKTPYDILPSDNVYVSVIAKHIKNGVETEFARFNIPVVCPANESNLVYNKVRIPEGRIDIKYQATLVNSSVGNNSVNAVVPSYPLVVKKTPDTKFENTPSDWIYMLPKLETNNSLSWQEWVYENGSFVKKTYTVKVNHNYSRADLIPDPRQTSRKYDPVEKVWYMRSGYGFFINAVATIETNAPERAYTDVQSALAYFPEFKYEIRDGYYRTLEYMGNNSFEFYHNEDDIYNDRIHFTPVWFPDRAYIVQILYGDLWTPVGATSQTVDSKKIMIDGDMYDDIYGG